jgi:hypothetical protein
VPAHRLERQRVIVDVPPMSNHRGTHAHDVALDVATPTTGTTKPRCSLERR